MCNSTCYYFIKHITYYVLDDLSLLFSSHLCLLSPKLVIFSSLCMRMYHRFCNWAKVSDKEM